MMRLSFRLWQNDCGAVAPTVALSIVGLVAVGGIAFDYSRLLALDTELQNAADQAALAAATQLDGEAGACSRASSAAVTMVANQSRFADDTTSSAITIPAEPTCDAVGSVPANQASPGIRFWQDEAKTVAATTDANANFVEVTVNYRRANYALTPIVAALSSGDRTAAAMAGIQTAVCRVPPVMMCNPAESTDADFTVSNYIGKGILLTARQSGAAYAPGNFGWLNTGYTIESGANGAAQLRRMLGQEHASYDCVAGDSVTTEPGEMLSVIDALNTRFDIYSQGVNQTGVCGGGQCPPANNARKDLVRRSTGQGNAAASCRERKENINEQGNGNQRGWQLPTSGRYLPTSATDDLASSVPLSPMGLPRDKCHATQMQTPPTSCGGGRVGTGNWDRAAYFRSNYGASFDWQAQLGSSPTRYQVYMWEQLSANRSRNPGGITQTPSVDPGVSYGTPICFPTLWPSAAGPVQDRRVIPVAVVNCSAEEVAGRTTGVRVARWIDAFLVEPSVDRDRTVTGEVYVEVVRESTVAGSDGSLQSIRRSIPYLVR